MTHYYDKKQTSPVREEELTVRVAGLSLPFFVASGLFSRAHLDNATKLLIENADLRGATSVLDLGCGWGVVACVMKHLFPDLRVTESDINERAVRYTKKNAQKLKTDIDVVNTNICEDLASFDVILTNPPYTAGRDVCYAFIEQSYAHLNDGGSLQLVARHQKGGKMLAKKIEEIFGNVDVIAKGSGFRIYRGIKNGSQ